jgi:hypothetical protein
MEWVDLENSKIVKNLGLTWGALLIKLFSLSLSLSLSIGTTNSQCKDALFGLV